MATAATTLLRHLRGLAAGQAVHVLSDQHLLERFVSEHSETSFAAIVERHGAMVLNVCRRVLHQRQDAEDGFQATFLMLARKAGSIRKRASLGSWLHSVAYHIAQRQRAKTMRRMSHERRLSPRPPGDAMADITWRELRSVLDEELQCLPEKYRAPLVLCYLEARTQNEAARRLGWSRNTFCRRIEQARQRLARRLGRRGLTLTAALTAPVLAESTATAVPALLAASTVRAGLAWATGNTASGLVPAHVAALARGGMKTLLASKVKWAIALFAALGAATGGVLTNRTLATNSAAIQSAASHPPSPSKPTPRLPARSASKDQAIEIKGRVLDPDGKPLADARLFLLFDAGQKKANASIRAMTDKEGRFRFTARGDELEQDGKVVATAKGYGPDWVELTADKKSELTLQLVPDDVPVSCRILNLEGRPVAAINVRAVSLERGDLDAWLEGTRQHRYPQWKGGIQPGSLDESAAAITGKDGRFRLSGFGRDRVVRVLLEGETIEKGKFEVVTRRELPPGLDKGNNGTYPATFDHLAGPSRPITGVVRDKHTSTPLADVTVACSSTGTWVRGTTDTQGRYRLQGVAKRAKYILIAGGLPPYFSSTKDHIADEPGLGPIAVDFALERGVTVRGKLLDKSTGRPIHGRVDYIALLDNPNLKDFREVEGSQVGPGPQITQADGSFAVVAVPGPGLLAAVAEDDGHYLAAVLPNPKPKTDRVLENYHAIVRIEPSQDDPKSTICDIALEPARTPQGSVIGSDGTPLTGVNVAGLSGTLQRMFRYDGTLDTSSFTAGGISPKRPRHMVFVHAEKKLAKVQQVRGDEKGPLTVRLEPLSAITGRIFDAGRPHAGLKVTAALSTRQEDYQDLPIQLLFDYLDWGKILNRETRTDAAGRFRIEGWCQGCNIS
jgi:RNA polymerase sigma factor (sigma-70 family)